MFRKLRISLWIAIGWEIDFHIPNQSRGNVSDKVNTLQFFASDNESHPCLFDYKYISITVKPLI